MSQRWLSPNSPEQPQAGIRILQARTRDQHGWAHRGEPRHSIRGRLHDLWVISVKDDELAKQRAEHLVNFCDCYLSRHPCTIPAD